MARLLSGLALALVLVLTSVLPATAQTAVPVPQTLTATVSVSSVLSVTLTDNGSAGLHFLNAVPGGAAVGEKDQTSSLGAVTLTVNPETTADCMLKIKGTGPLTKATGGETIALANLTWAKAYPGSPLALTTTEANVQAVGSGDAKVWQIWHYISVPAGVRAGDYSTAIVYSAS